MQPTDRMDIKSNGSALLKEKQKKAIVHNYTESIQQLKVDLLLHCSLEETVPPSTHPTHPYEKAVH